MLGKQSSNERWYLRREDGGRGIKSLETSTKRRGGELIATWLAQKTSGSVLHGEERTSGRRIL